MILNNYIPRQAQFYKSIIGTYLAIQVSRACLLGVCDFHCTANIMTARSGIYHYSKWNLDELLFCFLNSLNSPHSWIGLTCVILVYCSPRALSLNFMEDVHGAYTTTVPYNGRAIDEITHWMLRAHPYKLSWREKFSTPPPKNFLRSAIFF